MQHPLAKIHRVFELVEPIATVTFSEVPNEAFLALGMRNYWDGYFAGRAAPLGLAPAEVVHAVFYNFADGEVARHIPWVWGKTTPQEAIAVRERGSAAALRQRIGPLADSPDLVRVADLATRAAVSAPTEGRALYAGLRALDVPAEPVARLWHAATLLREHRGDGHNAALLAHGIGGTEAHVLLALSLGMRAEEFGRTHHLPKAQLAGVVDGLRRRGLVDAAGGFTDAGRETKERIEALTDELAAPAYDVLTPDEIDELIAGLKPIAATAQEVDD
ncbi:MarR family transcriptional regulator [Micromonospora sp. A3M-1-15]|uniref:MarR family winged helix-turn-helix transcriptional regulator n=1 Tax=Micromonospora sp. A3M-1-15 TaxID=2962035 RepID=UPI0020B7E0E9|nr:MarR family transcriptional regulator [Micromonospora sp. A3M-1-15]MCP3785405.1 MarR family transcriptional regulator [Micromonospora sp. A3M-1-15]